MAVKPNSWNIWACEKIKPVWASGVKLVVNRSISFRGWGVWCPQWVSVFIWMESSDPWVFSKELKKPNCFKSEVYKDAGDIWLCLWQCVVFKNNAGKTMASSLWMSEWLHRGEDYPNMQVLLWLLSDWPVSMATIVRFPPQLFRFGFPQWAEIPQRVQ